MTNIYIVFEIKVWVNGKEMKKRPERGKMTVTTKPEIEPGTSGLPGGCSISLASKPGPPLAKSKNHSFSLQPKEWQVTYVGYAYVLVREE